MSPTPQPDREESARARRRALAWLPASPAALAAVAAVLPWFAPSGAGRAVRLAIPEAFCWQAGRIGLLAPLAVVVVALSVLGPRHGWFGRGQQPRTLRREGLLLGGAGVIAGAVAALTWVLLPVSYSFAGLSWDTLAAAGYRLHRGPQPGYFLMIAAAVDAVGCGVVLVLAGRGEPRTDADPAAGIIDNHDGEDPGR